jgi:hypothetical protein
MMGIDDKFTDPIACLEATVAQWQGVWRAERREYERMEREVARLNARLERIRAYVGEQIWEDANA